MNVANTCVAEDNVKIVQKNISLGCFMFEYCEVRN